MDYISEDPGFLYQPVKEDDIDLGLSLRSSLQQESYHPSRLLANPVEYGDFVGWHLLKSPDVGCPTNSEDIEDETDGVQSKERLSYVKVNMEGVVVGRKVCIFDHTSYSSLALQLEEMFGRSFESGLQLFVAESGFSLLYKDRNEIWRTVGDVPWKEFVDCVKRLRIARKG